MVPAILAIMGHEIRRRQQPALPTHFPTHTRSTGRSAPARSDDPTAWVERAGSRDAATARVRPELRVGAGRGGAADAPDRIGAAAPRPDLDTRVDTGQRSTAIGATVDGVTFRPGLQSTSETDDAEATTSLLRDLDMASIADEPLRFRIGSETYTAGQLLREAEMNPARFDDFLHTHGIARSEFNELLDDIAANPNNGHTYDLSPGSELAQAYRIGGADGAVVDRHLDVGPTEARAAQNEGQVERLDVSTEAVEGPGFFQRILDALAEAVAWIGRLFGATWNPDTETFDGRVDDEHFRDVGRRMVSGHERIGVQALLAQPGGEDRVREQLLSQRPESATEAQWARAVGDVIEGMHSGLREANAAGALPADLTAEQQQRILVFLRANDFSSDAQSQVETILAQPTAVRDRAISLMVELPAAELQNMLALFGPLTSEGGYDDPDLLRVYHEASDPQKLAIFETMRHDGFRSAIDSASAERLGDAIDRSGSVPVDRQQEYLDLLPRVGLARMALVTNTDIGLLSRLQGATDSSTHATAVFDQFEAHVGNTTDAVSILSGAAFELTLSEPNARTITDTAVRRRVQSAFERTNTELVYDGTAIDVGRYLTDDAYRRTILTPMTGSERPSTRQLVEARHRFDAMLQNVAASIDSGSAPSNIRIDVSPGSQLNELFRLGGQSGPDAEQQLARRAILADDGLVDLTVVARGRGTGATAHTITLSSMASILSGDDPEATFNARYAGLDFNETVAAFARITARAGAGDLPGQTDWVDPATVDLTAPTGDAELDRIGSRLRDRTIGNIRGPSDMQLRVHSSSTAVSTNPSVLITDSELGAVAGNNWFQYGIFTPGTGSFTSRWAYERSRAAFAASGNTQDPAHALQAMFDLDGYRSTHDTSRSRYRETGIAHGQPEDFLTHPETGARATGADFQLVNLIGPGMGSAGVRDVGRVSRMFTEHGGVPESQVETHRNPTGQQAYDAIRAEIMRDPRPESDRDGPRTVVVYYSGHTGSYRDNSVAGFSLADDTHLTPQQVAELDRLAQERGVNMVMWTDACRSGTYVDQARTVEMADSSAEGTLTDDVRALAGLRRSLMEQHVVLSEINNRQNPSHSNACGTDSCPMPAAQLPAAATLARMGAAALRGGDPSDALTALHAERDRINADPHASDDDKRLIDEYVSAIDDGILHRTALADVADLDPTILSHGSVTGDTQWRSSRWFSSSQLGEVADRIGAELRTRLTPSPETQD